MVEITSPETANMLVAALSDDYSRKIMLATITAAKSVEDLSKENDIPLSTCYRRVHELLDARVLVVERIVVTPDGKRYELLRSAYRTITVNFENGIMKVEALVNEDVADKLRRMWVTMKQ
jgi:DNA-binding Lrp family transcriptional regulator